MSFVCHYEECQKAFDSKARMLSHIRSTKTHPCGVPCYGGKFPSDTDLYLKHLESSHYYCRVCCRLYRTSADLQKHFNVDGCHPSCEECGMGFQDDASLQAHTQVAHPAALINCPLCPDVVVSLNKIENHYWASLSHRKCWACVKAFSNEEAYEEHTKAVHKRVTVEDPEFDEEIFHSPAPTIGAPSEYSSCPGTPFTEVSSIVAPSQSTSEDLVDEVSAVTSVWRPAQSDADNGDEDGYSDNLSAVSEIPSSHSPENINQKTDAGKSTTTSPDESTPSKATVVEYHPRFHACGGHTVFLVHVSCTIEYEAEYCKLQVENVLFKVDKIFFDRDSSYFRKLFADQSCTEESPCVLHDIKIVDFERFLAVLYPTDFDKYDATTAEDWLSVLALATSWSFASIERLAWRELSDVLVIPIVDKILFGDKYHLQQWLDDAYVDLSLRPEPVTLEEGLRLGMERVIEITKLREDVRVGGELLSRRDSTLLAKETLRRGGR